MVKSTKELAALAEIVEQLTGERAPAERLSATSYLFSVLPKELSLIYYLAGAQKTVLPALPEKLIHLDHDVWLRNRRLVENRLKVRVGQGERLYARKGVIARVDKKRAVEFQQEHHLQQAVAGKYRYGLFIDGDLVALMVFSGGRLMRHTQGYRSFECLRFCSRQGTVVIGAFTRLMAFFVREFCPDDIMTYVDKDWSDGEKFRQMGFALIGETVPQQFWVCRSSYLRISEREYDKLSPSEKESYYPVENTGSLKMVRAFIPTI